MSSPRPRRSVAQLRGSYEDTLVALGRRFEQLDAAAAQFRPALNESALRAAWNSDDPTERNRADSVLASFEKTYMLLMDLITLSVKIARRLGASIEDDTGKASPIEILSKAGVISREAQAAIGLQRDVRNTSQHIYVELSVSALRDAVLQQLEITPRTIRSIVAWVESLEQRPA